MKPISRSFYKMPVNIIFFVGVPLFYFLFVLAYRPFEFENFLATPFDKYSLNLIVTSLIALGVMSFSRMLLFILRRTIDLNWSLYILWCTGEAVFAGLLMSIPLGIGWAAERTYFNVMTYCVLYTAGILVFPLAIISMAVQIQVLEMRKTGAPLIDERKLIRFHDEQKRLKIVLSSDAILYIQSEENYVHIFHLENGRLRKFTLRSSMRALEEQLQSHGLVRCHRSYFINPERVEILRKDSNGYFQAYLDHDGAQSIPVSRNYYQELTSRLP